jgi:hypothetical protein
LAYEYDVFLSYRRKPPVDQWVQNHFHPQLQDWLDESSAEERRVFIDVQAETGVAWPENLKRALSRSRLLVAVFSPRYFRSAWCIAEFQTMLERERVLGLRTQDNPRGLILPVRFSDGEHFPDDAKNIEQFDLSHWNFAAPAFSQSVAYLQFLERVQKFARDVSNRLADIPAWDDAWPIATPQPAPAQSFSLPRL